MRRVWRWRSECFETRCFGYSVAGVALLSTPCRFVSFCDGCLAGNMFIQGIAASRILGFELDGIDFLNVHTMLSVIALDSLTIALR